MSCDDSGYEVGHEGEIQHARQFARALLRDSRLTFSAKGLFIFLWDLPLGWRIRAIHLASVGPQRRDAVRAILHELEVVGALRVEAVRGERGRLSGKKWILRSPHLWAIESPLSRRASLEPAPIKGFTEGRKTRLSDDPKDGKPTSKVLNNIKVSSSTPPEILPVGSQASTSTSFGIGPAGLHMWTPADRLSADQLIAEYGLDAVASAVNQMDAEPLPSRVARKLDQLARAQRTAAKRAASAATPLLKAHLEIDPDAQAAGVAMLSKIRQKKSKQNQGAMT